jgi:hypothetical protein
MSTFLGFRRQIEAILLSPWSELPKSNAEKEESINETLENIQIGVEFYVKNETNVVQSLQLR